ncbi:hypothetical protein MNBD_ALPHA07-859 [hydrothermal vent metagenome]|uniref:Uncharacterized protein n=1 Tax=hydrothermal vent metagenome TaxID=652676 RepID=A0A3B0S5N7_9ZZZZ
MVNHTGQIVQHCNFHLIFKEIHQENIKVIIPDLCTVTAVLIYYTPKKVNALTLLICNFPNSCHSADTESDHEV